MSVINRRGALASPGRLVVFVLSVAGSYAKNAEHSIGTEEIPDTMQWWIEESESFRIRTFAIDHDIHVHGLASGGDSVVELAFGNAERVYGDVVTFSATIEISDPADDESIRRALTAASMPATAEIADRFLFWLPDTIEPYRTKSEPVDEPRRVEQGP